MVSPNELTRSAGIEALYLKHRPSLLTYLTRLVGDPMIAEDLCQETFVKSWRAWDTHHPTQNVRGWLFRIATNTAYDHLRRQRPTWSFSDYEQSLTAMGETHDHDAEVDLVAQVLASLPMPGRTLLVLRYYQDLHLQQIADLLGCPVGTVKSRLHRARKHFQQSYRTYARQLSHQFLDGGGT